MATLSIPVSGNAIMTTKGIYEQADIGVTKRRKPPKESTVERAFL